jgi:thiamine pyrophosphate-dependent acetolactate synthase large subunit-like protein
MHGHNHAADLAARMTGEVQVVNWYAASGACCALLLLVLMLHG